LAYSAAASGWHAVEWTSPWAWVWIGACWAFALPILVWVNASSTQGQIPRSEWAICAADERHRHTWTIFRTLCFV